MSELINTLCSGGRLIVTENSVIIKLGNIKEEALPRAGLTVSSKMGGGSIIGTRTMTFQSQGGKPVTVRNVAKKKADQIVALLR
jgi:hypothetical protein